MTHAHSIDTGASHGSVRSYVVGFILSVVLTVAAFGVVMGPTESIIAIAVLAFIQILVHLVFFLHMNTSSSQRWNVVAFGFTVMVAVIVIGGTLWVLHNVGAHMMSR
jgi:cytochrome o ubiquinol oxidase operon protein cyoD